MLTRWYHIEGEHDEVRDAVEAFREQGFEVVENPGDPRSLFATDGDYSVYIRFDPGAGDATEAVPPGADLEVAVGPVPDMR